MWPLVMVSQPKAYQMSQSVFASGDGSLTELREKKPWISSPIMEMISSRSHLAGPKLSKVDPWAMSITNINTAFLPPIE